jgi:ferritin
MLSQLLIDALNQQYTRERQNAEAYEALAVSLEVAVWSGSAKFMQHAAQDERSHAKIIKRYLIDRLATPIVGALAQPVSLDAGHLPQAFRVAFVLEHNNTEALKELYYLAENEEDPQTCVMLIPLLEEQTRSEGELNDIIIELTRCDAYGWVVLDHRIGKK